MQFAEKSAEELAFMRQLSNKCFLEPNQQFLKQDSYRNVLQMEHKIPENEQMKKTDSQNYARSEIKADHYVNTPVPDHFKSIEPVTINQEPLEVCEGKVDSWLYDISFVPVRKETNELDRFFECPISEIDSELDLTPELKFAVVDEPNSGSSTT